MFLKNRAVAIFGQDVKTIDQNQMRLSAWNVVHIEDIVHGGVGSNIDLYDITTCVRWQMLGQGRKKFECDLQVYGSPTPRNGRAAPLAACRT